MIALSFLVVLLTAPPVMVDRIVALVDDDPILLSDLERAIDLGLVERQADEAEDMLRRRVLDELIVQRLRYHEVDRDVALPVADAAIEEQLEAVRRQWRTRGQPEGTFEAWLAARGLEGEGLRRLLGRQLRVLSYIEERLGPRVFVDLDDVTTYYENELLPELEAKGEVAPPLPEVRESIRELLRQKGLDREIDLWTETLRAEADVVNSLERAGELPPIERVIGPPVGGG